ncbi:MAG: YciI family protein [Burkholderiales bacterium]
MKYLCLICAEKVMEQMDEAVAEKHYQDYAEFTEAIRKSGHYVGCNRLLPPAEATTIRVRNGKISATDGPWVETKEQLGGYYVIEARDLNEAIQVAARIPGGWVGCVEVRPIAEDERTLRAIGDNPA